MCFKRDSQRSIIYSLIRKFRIISTPWMIYGGLLALLLPSCFQTRDVEPPSSSSSDWVSPTDYQILLNNFQTAINQLNVQNYLRVFNTDVFRFTPAASLADDNQNLWSNWSSLDEQTYLENTIARLRGPSGNTLILQQTDLQDFGDSIRYAGNYTLRFNHNDTTITDLFKGQLLFIIRRNTFNELEIHRWEDLETVPDSSWSELKQKFIQ